MKYNISILLLCLSSLIQARSIEGWVYEIDAQKQKQPLVGVNVYWAETALGTATDTKGHFSIDQYNENFNELVFSYVGYQTDTIEVNKKTSLEIVLQAGSDLAEVTVNERVNATSISKINPMLVETISGKELNRFACCNLSESFETNPSVDVGFSDAVSGIKQIKLLGLSGRYAQIMMENNPILRGSEGAFGLEYIPGTWMESIQVSKGAGSVINGYESVSGQINIQYKEPFGFEQFHFYTYANQDGKIENNMGFSQFIGDKWSVSLLTHLGGNFRSMDSNNDGFLDRPQAKQANIMNRWQYKGDKLMWKLAMNYLLESRKGGQLAYDFNQTQAEQSAYGIGIEVERLYALSKLGYTFSRPATSVGWISSVNHFDRQSFYGLNTFNTQQLNIYSNFLFQSYIGSTQHKFTTGWSLVYDQNKDVLNEADLGLEESVWGAFGEYNYAPNEQLSILLGMRVDHSSLFGTFATPRLHLKYNFKDLTTLRLSAGKGYRTPRAVSENTNLLASSRSIVFEETLEQEKAWNYGINLVNYIPIKNKELQWTVDFFRTDFQNQLIVDLEDVRSVRFYNLNGKSYANSLQSELSMEILQGWDFKLAYRLNDVKSTFNGVLKEVPMVSRHKGLINTSYTTKMKKWSFDATLQFHGYQQLPSTEGNSAGNLRQQQSDSYVNLIAQITKNYRYWSFYVGGENLGSFVQQNAIVDPENPFGDEFDASMVWGPLYGRMFYAGVKYILKRN